MQIGMIRIPIPIKTPRLQILAIPIRILVFDHANSNSDSFLIRLIGQINDSDSDSDWDSDFCDSKREALSSAEKWRPGERHR